MNEQPVFIEAFQSLTSTEAIFYLYQDKEQILISYVAFVKNRRIVHPFYFFYSSLWVGSGLSDAKYGECLTHFMSELKRYYRAIVIKLPVEITDIRPFIWNSFSIAHHYTYVKDLSNLSYHHTTKKNINKCKLVGYSCSVDDLNSHTLNLNLHILSDLGFFGKGQIETIGKLLTLASEAGYLKSFNCYKDAALVASNLILMDPDYKIAYTILLNKVERKLKDDVHSLLHDFFFNELLAQGYEKVDLMGADIQRIAEFKSRFNATLTPHFVVNYRQSQAMFNRWILKLKYRVKRLIYN